MVRATAFILSVLLPGPLYAGDCFERAISPQRPRHDPWLNVYTGTYYLAKAFQKWGVSWQAVGAYNAGFQHSARQAMRRYAYASRIARTYRVIKTMRSDDDG